MKLTVCCCRSPSGVRTTSVPSAETYKGERFRFKDDAIVAADIRYAARNLSFLRRVFLTDGDALILPQTKLIWLLTKIREEMPWITRVGLYGNAKSILRKTPQELEGLRELGLGIVYLGLESGDAEVLREVRKGAAPERMIEAGRRVREAGLKLSVTVLLGYCRAGAIPGPRPSDRGGAFSDGPDLCGSSHLDDSSQYRAWAGRWKKAGLSF